MSLIINGLFVLLAPQGFRNIANKEVKRVFHSDTRTNTLR
jgi:hypothetical protein